MVVQARTIITTMLTSLLLMLSCHGPERSCSVVAPPVAPPVATNILVIVADDLGWPERALLPALDSLASQGVTLERFYTYPTCTPTRIALQAGRYPRREGIGDLSMNAHDPTQDRLRLDLKTLPELFKPGKATALIGKWHIGRAKLFGEMDQVTSGPYCQGYDTWAAGNPTVLNAGFGSSGYRNWWRVDNGDQVLSTQYATDAQRDEFLSYWVSTPGPKFTVLAWSAPHGPYNLADTPPGYTFQGNVRADYEQTVAYLNTQLAVVLASVNLADTVVVFIADNGTPDDARPNSSPSLKWKGSTYEGGVRVPCVIAGPGISQGVVSQRVVSVTDLAATLAELSAVPITSGFEDSQSFANELGAWTGTTPRTFVFTERYEVTVSTASVPQPIGYDDQAVIEKQTAFTTPQGQVQLKLKLRRVDADGTGPNPSQDWVYDLITDPNETNPGDPLLLPPVLRNRLYAELNSIPPRAP